VFWVLQIWIIYRGMNAVRVFENWAAPLVLVMAAGLLAVVVMATRRRLGPRDGPSPRSSRTAGEFWKVFIPALTGDGRLLGHAVAQHPGLHALRPRAEGADARPGARPADDDDRVLGDGGHGHERGRKVVLEGRRRREASGIRSWS
jgi:hypothetical protein